MEVVPVTVGVASRAWDEQHLDLAAAADQVRDAGTSGFTGAVAGVAARFSTAWHRLAADLGVECEGTADGLRTAIRDYVESDQARAVDALLLRQYLQELR